MKDYYGILGVHRNAGQDEIIRVFRRLSKKYHPDTTRGDKKSGEDKFKEVLEAYETLSDPERRKKYDTELELSAQKSVDLHMYITVSYEDAELGGEKKVRTPDGRRIAVLIPENMRDGRRIRLEGQGAFIHGSVLGRGDLYVTVRVQSSRDQKERNRVKHIRQIMRELNVDVTLAKKIEEKIRTMVAENAAYIHTLENRYTRLDKEVGSLKNDNGQLRTKIDHLDRVIQTLVAANEELSDENSFLENENEDIRNVNARLVRLVEVISVGSTGFNEYSDTQGPLPHTPSDMFTTDNVPFEFYGNEPEPVSSGDEYTEKQPSASRRKIPYVGDHVRRAGKNIFRRRKKR